MWIRWLWGSPWTEEPGGLQSMGHKEWHNKAINIYTHKDGVVAKRPTSIGGLEHWVPPWPPGFPGGSTGKEFTCKCGRPGFDPWVRKAPWRGNSYPLQYSGLENSMDCIVHGITKIRHKLVTFTFFLWPPGKGWRLSSITNGLCN